MFISANHVETNIQRNPLDNVYYNCIICQSPEKYQKIFVKYNKKVTQRNIQNNAFLKYAI